MQATIQQVQQRATEGIEIQYPTIIPQQWSKIQVSSEEDLLFLGRHNLEFLSRYWGQEAREFANQLQQVRTSIRLTNDENVRMLLRAREGQLEGSRVMAIQNKTVLSHLTKKAEEKPLLTMFRTTDWFHLDELVVFYTRSIEDVTIFNDTPDFVNGKVTDIIGHHGIIEVYANQPFHSGSLYHGSGATFSETRLELMLRWEYDYLKEHPEYMQLWLKYSPGKLDTENFARALSES